ncbi:MAG: hypothetical protein CME47_09615 [Halieaceae bacterium]|jgi:hypothetical protein|nr:hypothetical protein [Halieaceae bacterium]|tara:strand:+ start:3214 stop:3492 length:279 start_codon:yes stop_codon:yes gene_type:complete
MKEGAQPTDKPVYFEDPAVQALYQMVLILGEELAATREQLHALISLCEQGKVPSAEALEAFVPEEHFDLDRAEWVSRLLEPLQHLSSQPEDS